MEGTSSSVSAVMTSALNEHQLIIPRNILCSLKVLSIESCLDLEFCGGKGDFRGFTSLVTLMISDCPKLVPKTKDGGTVDVGVLPPLLEGLRISHLPEKIQFPEGLLNLKKLTIFESQFLKSVQLHSCMALEELQISGCEHIDEIDGLQRLTSLRSLSIRMNTELSCAWDLKLQGQEQGSNQIQLLPPSVETLEIWDLTDRIQSHLLSCLPAMTRLKIHESLELTSIQLGYCTSLKELEIRDCESLAWIEGFQFTRSLTALTVSNSPSLPSCLELVSKQHGASEIWSGLKTLVASDASVLSMPFCKQLTSLTHLQFRNLRSKQRQSMVSLTEEQERALELLSSLQELRFMFSDLLSLPTNLHRLTSLESLCITGCQSIARLPDTGLPPLLSLLSLSGCSEGLGTQCRMAATHKLTVSIDKYVDY
jgi:Leucine-rich repeat (LRR) protein